MLCSYIQLGDKGEKFESANKITSHLLGLSLMWSWLYFESLKVSF